MTRSHSMILLTGATGLLGRYILRDLLLEGFGVATLVRDGTKARAADRVAEVIDHWNTVLDRRLPEPVVVAGDLLGANLGLTGADRRWLASRCDAVVHAAASLEFRPSLRGEPHATNVVGTGNLVEFCRRIGVSEFHYVSTAFVCGEIAGPVLEDDQDEDRCSHNVYEKSKSEAEAMVRVAAGLRPTVYRPSVIVGDSQTGYTSTYHGIYRFIELASRLAQASNEPGDRDGPSLHLPLRLPLTGDEHRDLVPVDWVARAIVSLVDRPDCHGRTYHLTASHPVPARLIKDVAEEVLGIEGVRFGGPEVFDDPTPLERGFLDHIQEFWPYLHGDPRFDRRNLDAALPDLPCVRIDRPMLARLIRYAVSDGWGRRSRRNPTRAVSRARINCRLYVEEVFPSAMRRSRVARAAGLDVTVALEVIGPGGGQWTCEWIGGDLASVHRGLREGAEVRYRTDSDTFDDVIRGRQSPQEAFFARRIEVAGDVEKALKLAVLFGHFLTEDTVQAHSNQEGTDALAARA
jgi:thioester reductase-like protein/putative sterol carrier protein